MNVTKREKLLKSLLLSWKNLKLLNTLTEVALTFEESELTSLHAIPRAEARTLVIIKKAVCNKNARSVDLSLLKATEDLAPFPKSKTEQTSFFYFLK